MAENNAKNIDTGSKRRQQSPAFTVMNLECSIGLAMPETMVPSSSTPKKPKFKKMLKRHSTATPKRHTTIPSSPAPKTSPSSTVWTFINHSNSKQWPHVLHHTYNATQNSLQHHHSLLPLLLPCPTPSSASRTGYQPHRHENVKQQMNSGSCRTMPSPTDCTRDVFTTLGGAARHVN
jgi:hypothetical protein